jgi:glycosyltransferase involved in cell wall biosynthesis
MTVQLVEDVPHASVQQMLREADIVVDQLLLGWYGGVAVEAMALGRPVVAHLHGPDLARLPQQMRADLPVMDATPETLDDVLRTLAARDLDELGRQSRGYVEQWHDPSRIAAKLGEIYERSFAAARRFR